MGKSRLSPLVLVVAGGVFWGGCRAGTAAGKQPDGPSRGAPKVANVVNDVGGLTANLAEVAPSRRTFLQVDLGRRGASPRAFERRVQSLGHVEGSLIGRVDFPLDQYLDPHSRGENRPRVDWPRAGRGRMDAFFIEFKPAIMEWPAEEAQEDETVEALAQVTAFEHDGVPFAYGTCRRTMRVAEFEKVMAGGQSFENAVRMEADTELTFGWMATIRVQEKAWFARGAGLVRREERFNGRALWLFRIQGAGRYELADDVTARMEIVADEAGESVNSLTSANGHPGDGDTEMRGGNQGLWSRLAICFERSGRHIRVSGSAVEWAGSNGEPAAELKQR